MLRSYKFVETNHSKLNEFVLAFFRRIENETGEFDDIFFGLEFIDVVNSHKGILKNRFIKIYNKFKKWTQAERTAFCNKLTESNNIEEICQGKLKPLSCEEFPPSIKIDLKELFIDLYEKILKKSPHFCSRCGTLLEHFRIFKSQNRNILCPACGLKEVKTQYDTTRNQYDHYLPKSIYPLSSVNFKNLVPLCTECNSLGVKGEKDVLKETNGKLFYPYDESHSGIDIKIDIKEDAQKIDNIKWELNFSTLSGQKDEIESWKYIFNIESRYEGYIKGRIDTWYGAYWDSMNDSRFDKVEPDIRKEMYFAQLEHDEANQIDYIRNRALKAFINDALSLRAELEAKIYSLPPAI